jgi:hypothetical protein
MPQLKTGRRHSKPLQGARHQQAKSWGLRAATSLARLSVISADARELLAPVYGWFRGLRNVRSEGSEGVAGGVGVIVWLTPDSG